MTVNNYYTKWAADLKINFHLISTTILMRLQNINQTQEYNLSKDKLQREPSSFST